MQHFKTLSSYLDYLGLPRPEHPMLSVFNSKGSGYLPCPRESSPPIRNRRAGDKHCRFGLLLS